MKQVAREKKRGLFFLDHSQIGIKEVKTCE